MGKRITVESYVDVEVDLEDISTHDLIEELENRNQTVSQEISDLVSEIHNLRRLNQSYDRQLDDLIYHALGRLI